MWVPTARGWVVLAGILVAFVAFVVRPMNSFLCLNRPVPAEVLVVESWLPDYALQGAVEEFKRGGYRYVITSGQEFTDAWIKARYRTAADFAAADLAALGLPSNTIVPVPAQKVVRDRTYASALAVRKWLESTGSPVRALNVYTAGPHARRSRLLFQKALGKKFKVGVISHPENSYDPKRWWTTMYGFSVVTGEAIAYLYARVLFHPSEPTQSSPPAPTQPGV